MLYTDDNPADGHCGSAGGLLDPPGMMLLLGPPNSGKLGRILEWWGGHSALDPVVVVPTAPDAHETTLEMIERRGALFGSLPAQTFDGLVAEVLGRRPRYATGFERDLILAKILAEADTGALRSMGRFPGTLQALGTLVTRLSESGRSPDEIAALFDAWQEADHGSRALVGDLASVLRVYDKTMTGYGLTDRPAAVREAGRHVADWCRPVAFYGFTSFTPGQTAFIEALAARVPVAMSLAYDDRRSVNPVEEREMLHWRERAAEVVPMRSQDHAYSSPAIAFLERNLFSPSGDEPPADTRGFHGVRFLSSSGQHNEAEVAAQHIASLIKGGFAPERIGVVVRRVEGWDGLLARVFRSCNIPFGLDTGHRFDHTGLGHALLSGLRAQLAAEDAPVDGLRATAYWGGAGAALPFAAAFTTAVSGGGGEEPADLVHLDGLEALAGDMLSRALEGVDVTGPEAEDDVRAFRALIEALDSLRLLSDDGRDASWLQAEIVLQALGRLIVSNGPVDGRGAVQVLTPQRARARRFDAVFVLGLVDGEFPGHSDAPMLLSEEQRRRIDHLGGGVLPPSPDMEAALFSTVVSRAWQVLYLSSRDSDDGGAESMPSRFWSASRALLDPEGGVHHHRSLAQQTYLPEEAPSVRHHRRALAVAVAARQGSEGGAAGAARAQCGGRRWYRGVPRLTDADVLDESAARDVFSPSELEGYLRCPFSWFIQRVVGAEPAEAKLDGRVRGELLHAALSATFRALHDERMLPLRPSHCERAIEIAREVLAGVVADDSCPGSPAQKRIAAASLRYSIDRYIRAESEADGMMSATETEVSVGGGDGIDIGGISIRGRIDRIDIDESDKNLFIIDYKSGGIPAAKALGSAEGLQMPLYLMAMGVERPEWGVLGGAYVSLRKEARSGVVFAGGDDLLRHACRGCKELDAEGREALFSTTVEVASAAAEGIRAGRIAPPEPRECPSWCEYGPICRSRVGGYRP